MVQIQRLFYEDPLPFPFFCPMERVLALPGLSSSFLPSKELSVFCQTDSLGLFRQNDKGGRGEKHRRLEGWD